MSSYLPEFLGGKPAKSDFTSEILPYLQDCKTAMSVVDPDRAASFAARQASRYHSQDPDSVITRPNYTGEDATLTIAMDRFDKVDDFFNAKWRADETTGADRKEMVNILSEQSQYLSNAMSQIRPQGETGVFGTSSKAVGKKPWWGATPAPSIEDNSPSTIDARTTVYPKRYQQFGPAPSAAPFGTPTGPQPSTTAQTAPSFVNDLAQLIVAAASSYNPDFVEQFSQALSDASKAATEERRATPPRASRWSAPSAFSHAPFGHPSRSGPSGWNQPPVVNNFLYNGMPSDFGSSVRGDPFAQTSSIFRQSSMVF